MCTLNVTESEFHFLLCCPKYRDTRKKYFKNISWPTLNKFDFLMSSESKNTKINIAKYIKEALSIREISLT